MKTARNTLLRATLAATAICAVVPGVNLNAQDKLNVVTSLTTYADFVRQIGGDRVEVVSISEATENIHHVQPKPSLVMIAKRADMLVTTGLDLEMWLPSLLDKANNPRIASGSPGFVAASPGVNMLDVPETLSRSEGDSHVFGNHHIWTEPQSAIVIARNILAGLQRVDPDHAAEYEQRFNAWTEELMRAYAGDELVELLTTQVLIDMDRQGELWSFLNSQEYQGSPLVDRVGGWLGQARSIRDKEMICYHKQWSYLTRSFGVSCIEYVESRPGIPPTPRHVARVIRTIGERNIPVLLAVNYYDRDQIETVADRTGATAVVIPMNVGGAPGTDTYIDMMSLWINELTAAFEGQ